MRFQFNHRGRVLGLDIKDTGRRIDRPATPVSSAIVPRHLDRVFCACWSIDSFIARVLQLFFDLRALRGIGDIRIDVIRRKRLRGKGWGRGGEGLRRPGVLARHI